MDKVDEINAVYKFQMDNLPLHFAARNRSLFHFKRVMETDDENSTRRKDEITALYHAACKCRLDVVKYLMNIINEKGPHDRYAVTYEHLDICQYLMENDNGIYKNARDQSGYKVLHLAALFGHAGILKCIMRYPLDKSPRCKAGKTPLHYAAMNGNLAAYEDILEYVVDKHPRCNAGKTPLHFAAMNGNFAVSKCILEGMAVQLCYTPSLILPPTLLLTPQYLQKFQHTCLETCFSVERSPKCNDGKTPIHYAAWKGHSPFHEAARSGHLDVCEFFMETFDVKDIRNNNGSTPLHLAAWYGNYEVCKFILKTTKCINPLNYFGETPIDNARLNTKLSIVKLINGFNQNDKNI